MVAGKRRFVNVAFFSHHKAIDKTGTLCYTLGVMLAINLET